MDFWPILLNQSKLIIIIVIHDTYINILILRNVITELLNNLPHMFKDTTRPESVYTSAVRGGLHALASQEFKRSEIHGNRH
jgi:protein transport protein SEC24